MYFATNIKDLNKRAKYRILREDKNKYQPEQQKIKTRTFEPTNPVPPFCEALCFVPFWPLTMIPAEMPFPLHFWLAVILPVTFSLPAPDNLLSLPALIFSLDFIAAVDNTCCSLTLCGSKDLACRVWFWIWKNLYNSYSWWQKQKF